jgi:hypothetical protein
VETLSRRCLQQLVWHQGEWVQELGSRGSGNHDAYVFRLLSLRQASPFLYCAHVGRDLTPPLECLAPYSLSGRYRKLPVFGGVF